MTQYEDVHEALEATALPSKPRKNSWDEGSEVASDADTILWRNSLLRFLDEICDDSLSVRDVREALDAYGKGESE